MLFCALCLFSCNKTSEIKCPDFDLQEKATSSVLLKGLDKFNYDLSTKRNIPRIYDYKSDSINYANVTRINWRQFWLADAVGAWQGGRSGFTYGCAFSPSGAIAGAVVGGLLCGTISSGIDYWVQRAPRMESSLINDLVQSNEIFNPETLYHLYTEITEKNSITLKEIDDSNTISIKIDTIYQVVGKAHKYWGKCEN